MNGSRTRPGTTAQQQALPEPQEALYAYLDALLQEIPEQQPALVNLVTEAEQEQGSQSTARQNVDSAPAESVTADTDVSRPDTSPDKQSGAPDWSQQGFQSLMFSVMGLHLSVPLDKLNGVIPWDSDRIVAMPGHSENFLGLLRHLDQNVKVIDLARLVVPDNGHADMPAAEQRVKHILLIDDGRWGLACDSINEILQLKAEDVRWRTHAGKRLWLAGTVIDKLCALLELDALVKLLETGKEQS